jgi:hypothetical protein
VEVYESTSLIRLVVVVVMSVWVPGLRGGCSGP